MMFQRFAKKVGSMTLARRVSMAVAILLMLSTLVLTVSGSTSLGAGLVVVDAPSGPDVTTTSTNWVDIPHMTGKVNLVGITDLAVTFCAEANVTNGKRMFVRALVDGRPSNPSDVVLAVGWTMDTHCFTFVKNGVRAGEHTIRMQWLVDSGGTAHVGDRTLHITFAQSNADELSLLAVAAPSGPDQVTTGGWTDIPDVNGNIHLSASSDVAITFSAEVSATNNRRLFIRALVDGQPSTPSDEVLMVGGYNGTRTFTFVKQGVDAGSHNVRVQWLVDDGGEGHVGDRTLKVVGVRRYDAMQAGRLMVAAPSGPAQTTTSTYWVDIPGLGGSIDVPAAGDIAIGFSAEIWASSDKRVFVRALVDGQPTNPSDVRLITGEWRGTYAFSFVKRNVSHGSHTIQLQWAVDSGGEAAVGDRTLTAYTFARPYQTAWTQLPAIDSFARPAILSLGNTVQPLSHFVGRIYTVAIAHNRRMYFTSRPASITDSSTGWDDWRSVGPGYRFDPYTPPVLVGDGDTIYLFARGTDNNLYESHRTLSANWSNWQQLTSNGPVRGRLSVALTRPSRTLDVHAIYTSVNNMVEYRQFDSSWAQVGSTEQWSNALEGTIATDGVNEVWAVIRTNDRRLLIEKKNSSRSASWQAVTARLADGNQGAFFDISNFVFFGEAYHIAYSLKYLCDDVSGAYCHSLVHTRIRTGQPDEGYVRFITDYTPQGNTHPQAELIVYRNKLVMAYKDHQGWVRYAYWDSADPATPWIGMDIVAEGRTSHRPALALSNQCKDLRSPECVESNFGNDILAVANDFTANRLWFINFSRAFFKQRLSQIGVAAKWCTEYVGTREMAKCPPLDDRPDMTELPVFTEVGYGTIVLPDWLMSQIFWRTLNASGQTELHTTWVHTEDITRPWVGPNINIGRKMDYFRWWDEGGHVLASGFGLCDDGYCPPNPPDVNLMDDFVPNSAIYDAFTLFAQRVNDRRSCQAGTGSNDRRCRGFTGHSQNYDVTTRQHSFMYPLLYYYARGDQLRQWVQEDLENGDDLLAKKYDWIKQNIFQGVEFKRDAEPVYSQ